MVNKVNLTQIFSTQLPEKELNALKRDLALKLLTIELALSHIEKLLIKAKGHIDSEITSRITQETSNKSPLELIQETKTSTANFKKKVAKGVAKAIGSPKQSFKSGDSSGFPSRWDTPGPPDFDGSNTVIGRLMLLLKELEDGNNTAVVLKQLQKFLEDLFKSKFAKDPAKIAEIMKLLGEITGNTQSFLELLGKFLAESLYAELKGKGDSDAEILAQLKKLAASLGSLFGENNPEVLAIKDFISNFSDWTKTHSDDYLENLLGQLAVLIQESNASGHGINQLISNWRYSLFEAALKKLGPMYAITYFFMTNLDFQQSSLGGYANLLKYIQKQIDNLKKLEGEFNNGDFSSGTGPGSAANFIKELEELKKLVDNNPAFSGIKDQVDDAVNAILNAKIDTGSGSTSLLALFKDGNYSDLAKYLNKISDDPTGPVGRIILNNFKILDSAFTNQSALVNTEINQANSEMQQMLSGMNKTINEGFMGMINSFVKNQRAS